MENNKLKKYEISSEMIKEIDGGMTLEGLSQSYNVEDWRDGDWTWWDSVKSKAKTFFDNCCAGELRNPLGIDNEGDFEVTAVA